MKELKTVCDELIKFFNIDDIGYLGDKLKEIFGFGKKQIN